MTKILSSQDMQFCFKICYKQHHLAVYFCINFAGSEMNVSSEFTIPFKDYSIIS